MNSPQRNFSILVVGYAGQFELAGVDTHPRAIARAASRKYGQVFVRDNRTGTIARYLRQRKGGAEQTNQE